MLKWAGVDEALRWKHLDSASVVSPLLTFGSAVEWASFKFPSCTFSVLVTRLHFWFLLSSYLTLSLPAEPVRWWLLITDQRLLGLVNLPDDFRLDEHTVASRQRLTPTHSPTPPTLTTVLLTMVLIFVAEGQTELSSDLPCSPALTSFYVHMINSALK